MSYYQLTCLFAPECSYTGIDNSKKFMKECYFRHYMDNHYHKPIIEKYDRKTTKAKKVLRG